VNTTHRTRFARLALCLGLASPLAAWSVTAATPAATPAASKPAATAAAPAPAPAVKKVDAKMPKAKDTSTAPGCDESNSPGKKLPGTPKCPADQKVKASAQQN
jgi:hypothetical protein